MNPQVPLQPPLKPPQFSLRTLFVLLTLVACLSVLATVVSPPVFGGILFLTLSIAAHVAGNKLGTTLRAHASRQRERQAFTEHPPRSAGELTNAPTTRLRERTSLGIVTGLLTLAGTAGSAALAAAGSLALSPQATAGDLIVYGVAGAVLGGFFTFAIVAFVQVTATAAWEASCPAQPTPVTNSTNRQGGSDGKGKG